MTKEIVMEVPITCEKCKRKALKIASEAYGVIWSGVPGEEGNRLVVIGNGVDAAKLASRLTKKVGYTRIIRMADLHHG